MRKQEIDSLIKLLDDPDDKIFIPVYNKLSQASIDNIKYLEEIWEKSQSAILQSRIENVIQQINKNQTINELKQWVQTTPNNLLKGAVTIAKLQYPHIKYKTIEQSISKIVNDIWLEINEELTILEKIKIINHILFDVNKYHSDTSPQNNNYNLFINNVIDSKKGSDIILAIIYAEICQKLNLNVFGVPLAKNFILCVIDEKSIGNNDYNILFYINPFNKGLIFNKNEIKKFIKRENIDNNSKYFLPIDNIEVIKNLIIKIILFYEKQNNKTKAIEYRSILKIL